MLCDCAVKADEPTKGHRAKNLKERHEKGCLFNISALGYFFSCFGNGQNIDQRHPVGLFHGNTNIFIINRHHIIIISPIGIISSIGINHIITISSIGIAQRHFFFSIQKSTGQWVRLIRCGFINNKYRWHPYCLSSLSRRISISISKS